MMCIAGFKLGLGQVICRSSKYGIVSMSVEVGVNAGSMGCLVFGLQVVLHCWDIVS